MLTKSYWHKRLWPVHSEEVKTTLQVALLKALISSAFCIFSSTKDAVVIASVGGRAEVLPVLKGIFVPIISIIFAFLYALGCNKFRPYTIFRAIMAFFFVTLCIYNLVLLPHQDLLTPTTSADRLLHYLGPAYSHWVAVYRNWIASYYYLVAELWSQAVIFVGFWELANRLYTLEQAQRLYSLFVIGGTLGNLITVPPLLYLLQSNAIATSIKMRGLTAYIALLTLLCTRVYQHISSKNGVNVFVKKKPKEKISFLQGIRFLAQSKYVLAIAVTVIAVGMSINLVEVTWKANLKLLFTNDETAMAQFMAKTTFLLNTINLVVVFFLSGPILRKLGWRFSAQLPPLLIGGTGVLFFLASKYKHDLAFIAAFFHTTPLHLAVYAGALQSIISKVGKYAFFDMTKEMSYIPLPAAQKAKSKAAIDAVGSRLGKSGSSAVHLSLLFFMGTSSALCFTHWLIPILLMIVLAWCFANRYIANQLMLPSTPLPNSTK